MGVYCKIYTFVCRIIPYKFEILWLSVATFCNLYLRMYMHAYEHMFVICKLKWSVSYSKGIEI